MIWGAVSRNLFSLGWCHWLLQIQFIFIVEKILDEMVKCFSSEVPRVFLQVKTRIQQYFYRWRLESSRICGFIRVVVDFDSVKVILLMHSLIYLWLLWVPQKPDTLQGHHCWLPFVRFNCIHIQAFSFCQFPQEVPNKLWLWMKVLYYSGLQLPLDFQSFPSWKCAGPSFPIEIHCLVKLCP